MNRFAWLLTTLATVLFAPISVHGASLTDEQKVSDREFDALVQDVQPALINLLKSGSQVKKSVLILRANEASAALTKFIQSLERDGSVAAKLAESALLAAATTSQSEPLVQPVKSVKASAEHEEQVKQPSPPF